MHHRFNGAASFRTRKLGLGALEEVGHILGFNGAASFRTRKHPDVADSRVHIRMLQWGRVLSDAETPSTAIRSCSTYCCLLQWGRVLSDAETAFDAASWAAICCASMGPRPFGRGNGPDTLGYVLRVAALQWGRVLSDAETFR